MAAGTGYAKDWDIKTVSSGLIAYVVELVSIYLRDGTLSLPFQVRFSLSSESNYANVDFDYTKFYDGLVAHLNDPGLKEQNRRIHEFWNEYVFLLYTRLLLTALEATLLQCSADSEAKEGKEEQATNYPDINNSEIPGSSLACWKGKCRFWEPTRDPRSGLVSCMYIRFLSYTVHLTIFHSVDSSCACILSLRHSPRQFRFRHTSRPRNQYHLNNSFTTYSTTYSRPHLCVPASSMQNFARAYVNSLFCKYLCR
jgi:hypothetical protein